MELERDIDKYVTQACQDLKCRFRSDYSEISTQNAFRQLYAEFRVSQYIRQHMEKYALIVALGSDFFFVKNFPIQSIKNINEETILLSDMNDAEGYTNGVYVGKPTPVIKVMSRFQNLSEYDQLQRDYERILLESVLKNNLNREVIDLPFCKKRANGVVYLGPKFPEHFKKSCLKSS
jgi:hypothetical protein